MALQTRLLDYRDGALRCQGYLAWDDGIAGPRPAVAIAHTWAGRTEFECDKARRLAALGYMGFALDMYGEGRQGGSPAGNGALMQPLMNDRAALQRRIGAAITALQALPEVDPRRIAAMGYCFGGLCVLDLARSNARSNTQVRGVASFHGLFDPPGNTAGNPITAKVLCLHGYDDPMAKPEALVKLGAELTAAGADWQIHAYGHTLHAFTRPEANDPERGIRYSAAADRRSWRALEDFLEELFVG
ncbi:MAG: dienelactone hydrolase family protein [Porticoccaceae bacterium]